jgi:lipopolysaccharide transport system permease protein
VNHGNKIIKMIQIKKRNHSVNIIPVSGNIVFLAPEWLRFMLERPTEHITILEGRTHFIQYLRKVYEYRTLLRSFTLREIKVKYAQTVLGILWSIIQALVGIGIITFFFGYLLKIDTGAVPYPLYAFPGMIAWYYFSFIIGFSGNALLNAQHIIQKIYFPKIILPVAQSLVGLVDFVIWTCVLLVMMIFFQYPVTVNLVFLPVFIILNMLTGLSLAIWLSALTIRFRDLLIFIPYLIGFGIFITPVFFPEQLIPIKWAWVMYINPMAGVIAGLRWCLLGTELPSVYYLIGFIPVVILFITGSLYFVRIEGKISDNI